jgi:hypothetical protein
MKTWWMHDTAGCGAALFESCVFVAFTDRTFLTVHVIEAENNEEDEELKSLKFH